MSDKTGKSKSESSILGSLAKKLKKEDPAKGQGKAGRASANASDCASACVNSGFIKNETDRYVPIFHVNPVKECQLLKF